MSCERLKRVRNPRYKYKVGEIPRTEVLQALDFYASLGYVKPPDYYLNVPCGKCFSCKRARMLAYKIRLLSEVEHSSNSSFVTLTFDDYHLTRFKDNPNRAICLFLDRLRKSLGTCVRHWFTAEFGTKNTKRLHYHGLLFDLPGTFDLDKLQSLWKYGITHLGYVNDKTVPYLCKYLTKSLPGKKSPRIISSKGVGSHLVEDLSYLRDLQQPFINTGTCVLPIPRIIKDKLFDDFAKLVMSEDARKKPFKRYVDKHVYYTEESFTNALRAFSAKCLSLGLSNPVDDVKTSVLSSIHSFTLENKNTYLFSLVDAMVDYYKELN